MLSISVFDYRNACKAILSAALQRPQMYFKTLSELETFMRGHEAAFSQIVKLRRTDMLHEQFSKWLFDRFELSCASGWAYAIEQYSKEEGEDALSLFGRCINAFFQFWDRLDNTDKS